MADWVSPTSTCTTKVETRATLTIEPLEDSRGPRLVLEYRDAPHEGHRSDEAIRAVKRALARLGGIVPPGMTRVLPNGAKSLTFTLMANAARIAEAAL